MKNRVFLGLIVLTVLGCSLLGIDALVGVWKGTILIIPVTYEFKADHTFTSSSDLNASQITTGTYTHDDKTITMTPSKADANATTFNYTLSSDGKTLTLTNPASPLLSLVLTKQ